MGEIWDVWTHWRCQDKIHVDSGSSGWVFLNWSHLFKPFLFAKILLLPRTRLSFKAMLYQQGPIKIDPVTGRPPVPEVPTTEFAKWKIPWFFLCKAQVTSLFAIFFVVIVWLWCAGWCCRLTVMQILVASMLMTKFGWSLDTKQCPQPLGPRPEATLAPVFGVWMDLVNPFMHRLNRHCRFLSVLRKAKPLTAEKGIQATEPPEVSWQHFILFMFVSGVLSAVDVLNVVKCSWRLGLWSL